MFVPCSKGWGPQRHWEESRRDIDFLRDRKELLPSEVCSGRPYNETEESVPEQFPSVDLSWRAWGVSPMIPGAHHGAHAPRSPRHRHHLPKSANLRRRHRLLELQKRNKPAVGPGRVAPPE